MRELLSTRQQFNLWLNSPAPHDDEAKALDELIAACLLDDSSARAEAIFEWIVRAYQQGWLDAIQTLQDLNNEAQRI